MVSDTNNVHNSVIIAIIDIIYGIKFIYDNRINEELEKL